MKERETGWGRREEKEEGGKWREEGKVREEERKGRERLATLT